MILFQFWCRVFQISLRQKIPKRLIVLVSMVLSNIHAILMSNSSLRPPSTTLPDAFILEAFEFVYVTRNVPSAAVRVYFSGQIFFVLTNLHVASCNKCLLYTMTTSVTCFCCSCCCCILSICVIVAGRNIFESRIFLEAIV